KGVAMFLRIGFTLSLLLLFFAKALPAAEAPRSPVARLIGRAMNKLPLGALIVYSNFRTAILLGNRARAVEFLRLLPILKEAIEPRGVLYVHATRIAEVLNRPGFEARLERFDEGLALVESIAPKVTAEILPGASLWQVALDANENSVDDAIN